LGRGRKGRDCSTYRRISLKKLKGGGEGKEKEAGTSPASVNWKGKKKLVERHPGEEKKRSQKKGNGEYRDSARTQSGKNDLPATKPRDRDPNSWRKVGEEDRGEKLLLRETKNER